VVPPPPSRSPASDVDEQVDVSDTRPLQVSSGHVTAAAIADELHDRRLGLVSYLCPR
jgi:hypothetical protein